MSPRGGQKGFGTGTGPDDVTWSEDGGRHLTQAGELLLDAEQALRNTQSYDSQQPGGHDAQMYWLALSRASSTLATAQFVHRGVLALEKLAEAQRRTAGAVERLVEIEQRMLDADTRDKGPTT